MTYQKSKKQFSQASKHNSPTEPENEIDRQKRPLNNEKTFDNRECQATVAKNNRKNSTIRNDVAQTTDFVAFKEMFEYIKSDTTTLDTHDKSDIAAFYAGRSIFITGASGFVGKVCRNYRERINLSKKLQ